MIRRLPTFVVGAFFFSSSALFLAAQAPAPPLPPLTPEQKDAAAAVEAPKTFAPPPLPGQLQKSTLAEPPKPAGLPEPSPAPAPPAAVPAGNSASKMQALEAVTQQPAAQVAPRVAAPSDKIPVTTSTSTSGQFVVHGKVFETRSGMSTRCEEIALDLRKTLNDKQPWVLPIVVLLNTGADAGKSQGEAISTTITEIAHGGFHLQVTINERAGLNAAELRKKVVLALLAERIVRNHQKAATPEGRLMLPDWVLTGVLHAMDYKASARPSAIFSTIFRSGKIYGIEEIIAASPVEMDGLSRTIYETSCCALVLALVDQPNGPQAFNKFLNALASDPRSERELLDVMFPKFAASASSLNKWWSLQLAALSKPGIAEPFTPADSLKSIEDAIQIRYSAKPDEVPQGVKPRPFVLPPSLFVTPPPQPKPVAPAVVHHESGPSTTRTSRATSEAEQTTEDAAAAVAAAAGADKEDPKRPLWRRMLFLGASKPEDKPAETPPAPGEEESKPGFFGRLLGAEGGKKAAEEKPAENELPKVVATEKPKAAEKKEEPKPVEEEKPSKLNPLNWFRGGKKPAEEPKEETPAKTKEGQAFLLPPPDLDVARLLSPALADAWQMLAPAAPRQTVDMLKFLRRQPKAEDESKKEEPAPKPPASSREKGESKRSDSSATPRTSNPNAKPASRPKSTSSEGPRTNNPNATPVPKSAVPPTAATTGMANPGDGLVPVILPLEDYKLIMKRPDRAEIFNHNIATLRALDLRVSTLFRPVVLAYLALVTDLKEGKTKDMDKRLAATRAFALLAYQKSIAVRDYIDWWVANESGGLSGKFDDYLNLPAIIEKEIPVRTDPISKYLDAIDKEFSQ